MERFYQWCPTRFYTFIFFIDDLPTLKDIKIVACLNNPDNEDFQSAVDVFVSLHHRASPLAHTKLSLEAEKSGEKQEILNGSYKYQVGWRPHINGSSSKYFMQDS